MRYNTILANDVVNGEGVCVSFFVQGCPHRCEGCFNPETWDFSGGREYTSDVKWEIIKLISANNIQRNFSVLGGEPMSMRNLEMTDEVISAVRMAYPYIKIFLWTGFFLFDLIDLNDEHINSILSKVDYVIDGPFDEKLKDLSLKLRCSSNQRRLTKINNNWVKQDG